jgi:PAS domain S-box-containing protein
MEANPKGPEKTILEALSRALLDQGNEAIFVCDARGAIASAGAAARSLCGEEIVGRPFDEAVPLTARDGSRYSIAPVLSGAIHRLVEVAFRRKDDRFVLLLDAKPLHGDRENVRGCVVTLVDVTAAASLEEALKESEARFRRLVENARDVVYKISLDPEIRVEYISPSVEDFSGYAQREFYEDAALTMRMVHPDDRHILEEVISGAAGPESAVEVRWVRKDRSALWTEQVHTGVFDASGRLVAIEGIARDITKRKEAEQRVLQRERDYRALAENLPGMVYRVDLRGSDSMTFFNSMHEKLTGYASDELRHGIVCSIDPLILSPDREAVTAEVKRAVAEDRPFTVTYRLRRKDGEVRYFRERGRPVRGEDGKPRSIDGVIFDVTDQKVGEMERERLLDEISRSRDNLERAVRERTAELEAANRRLEAEIEDRRRLAAVIEQSTVAIALVDLGGVIRFANPAFEISSGRPRPDLVGRRYEEVSLAGIREPDARNAVLAAFSRGTAWRGRVVRRQADGFPRVLAVTVSPIHEASGRVTYLSVSEHDITRQAQLEENLRQKEKMEALGALASEIAHDLNNVLSPILVNSEMALLEVAGSPPAESYLATVLQAARRGRDLVGQILGFTRRREPPQRAVRIGPVIHEGLELVETTLPGNIAVHADLSAGSALVRADPTQVHQVLLNLISNAVHAMKEDGGVLDVRLTREEVRPGTTPAEQGLKPGPYLELRVADTGRGMTPEVLARVFDPFFTTKKPGEGSGIGMALVRRIVADQGGAVTVRSDPGRGTTVRVFFPCAAPEEGPGGPGCL